MTKVLSVRVTDKEYDKFHEKCEEIRCSAQEMLHACVVDVIFGEDYGVQRREQEGCTGTREAD
jgi:hypothetical protein